MQNKKIIFVIFLFIAIIATIVVFLTTIAQPSKTPHITTSTIPQSTTIPTNAVSHTINNEGFPDLQKEEKLPDGSTKSYLDSTNPTRANTVQSAADGSILFERYVVGPDASETLTSNITSYGTPTQIFIGSHFYGQKIQTYVFAQKGVAIIANQQTDQVFEKHFFPPMSVTEYVQRYGEDIVNK